MSLSPTSSRSSASGSLAVTDGSTSVAGVSTLDVLGGSIADAGGGQANYRPPGFEFGYDQIVSTVTVVSSTEASGTTVIACGAHTFDGAAVLAEFFSPQIYTPAQSNNITVYVCLFEGVTQIGRLTSVYISAAATGGMLAPGIGKLRFTPSAAPHTFTVTAFYSATDTGAAISAGPGGTGALVPAYIRFTKV